MNKDELENEVTKLLVDTCFTDEAMKEITATVKELYQKQRSNSQVDFQPLQKELNEIQNKINNWIEAIGEGLLSKEVLAEKIKEANNRKNALEHELTRLKAINSTPEVDEKLIISVMNKKKHLLLSSNEEERKRVTLRKLLKCCTMLNLTITIRKTKTMRFILTLGILMVETAGVEPASENIDA